MKNKKFKDWLLILLMTGFGLGVIVFGVSCVWIGNSVKKECQNARENKGGDCVEALIEVVEDDEMGYRRKNAAIWTLGQLGDSRALPLLKSYYTGNIAKKEPLDEGISQYELEKAIKLASGEVNVAAWVWRGLVKIDD